MPGAARFVAISATSKWEAELLRGYFLALNLLDPIGHGFGRGKYVVQGGAVIRGGACPGGIQSHDEYGGEMLSRWPVHSPGRSCTDLGAGCY